MHNPNPELLSKASVKGVWLLEQGVTDPLKWSRAMVYHCGEEIRPWLGHVRNAAEREWKQRQATGAPPIASPPIAEESDIASDDKPASGSQRKLVIGLAVVALVAVLVWLVLRPSEPSLAQRPSNGETVPIRAKDKETTQVVAKVVTESPKPAPSVATNEPADAGMPTLESTIPPEDAPKFVQGGKVLRVYPDGLLVEFSGGAALKRLKFRDLPETIQRQFRYNPQAAAAYEAKQAQGAAAYRADMEKKETQVRARQEAVAREAANEEREKLAILHQIVSDYHKSHTYSMADKFVCADMACDIWNMVKTKGFAAKLQVGRIDADITSIRDSNHAWVLAELTPGKWIALETTAGQLVFSDTNPRYYGGWSFDTPGKLKEFTYYGRQ
jgi:hypothetical protein